MYQQHSAANQNNTTRHFPARRNWKNQIGIDISITSENHYDAVSNKNKDAYICVMQPTDVNKAGLDVFTVLSPRQKVSRFECALTSPVQSGIQQTTPQQSEEPSRENNHLKCILNR